MILYHVLIRRQMKCILLGSYIEFQILYNPSECNKKSHICQLASKSQYVAGFWRFLLVVGTWKYTASICLEPLVASESALVVESEHYALPAKLKTKGYYFIQLNMQRNKVYNTLIMTSFKYCRFFIGKSVCSMYYQKSCFPFFLLNSILIMKFYREKYYAHPCA